MTLAFLAGIFTGAIIGVGIMCLMFIASRNAEVDRRDE